MWSKNIQEGTDLSLFQRRQQWYFVDGVFIDFNGFSGPLESRNLTFHTLTQSLLGVFRMHGSYY